MPRRAGFQEWTPPTYRGRAPAPPPRTIVVAANDSISLSDAAVTAQDFLAVAIDSISLSDSALAGLAFMAAANDSMTLTDSAVGEALALWAIADDSLALTDSAVSTSVRVAVAVDSLSRSDSAVALTARVAAASDSVSFSDSAATASSPGQPYYWVPEFDLTLLPFQDDDPVQVAAPPSGSWTDVTVTSNAELAAQIYTPFRRITVDGVLDGPVLNDGDIIDIHLILLPDSKILDPNIGAFSGDFVIERLMITGPTLFENSGGQLHHATFFGSGSDVSMDGLNHSGPGGNSGAVIWNGEFDRVNISNFRANCGGYFYIGTPTNFTCGKGTIQTGMDTVTPAESWGVRNSHEALGNIVGFLVDIRSNPLRTNNSHHRWRIHPDTGLLNFFLGYGRLIDRVQSRILWCNAAAGSGSGRIGTVTMTDMEIIATTTDPTDPPPSIEVQDADHVVLTNLSFQSDTFLSNANLTVGGELTLDDSNNTYDTDVPGTDPDWMEPGSPADIDWQNP